MLFPKPTPKAKDPKRLSRKSELKRGGPIERKTRLSPVNRARRAWKYERNYGDKADFVREQQCHIETCYRQSVAAHAKPRQSGGCGYGKEWLVDLCYWHHEEAGEHRTSQRARFEAKYGTDLEARAEALEAEWQRMQEAA